MKIFPLRRISLLTLGLSSVMQTRSWRELISSLFQATLLDLELDVCRLFKPCFKFSFWKYYFSFKRQKYLAHNRRHGLVLLGCAVHVFVHISALISLIVDEPSLEEPYQFCEFYFFTHNTFMELWPNHIDLTSIENEVHRILS